MKNITSETAAAQTSANPEFAPVEPWPDPVEGHVLLDGIVRELVRFVVFPKWAAETFALWIAHTYCFHLRHICTYIAVESPDKECGKSTLLNVLAAFVNRPVVSSNITSSAFFRLIEEFTPTLLIDEADTNLRGSEELRGILNAGYFKPNAFVWRVAYDLPSSGHSGGSDSAPKEAVNGGSYLARFTCWCPKVIASIGRVHETLASRCIVVRMQRKTRDEECERLRFMDATALKRQCARFALDHAEAIGKAQPLIPEGLANRAADVWEPLLAIADLAGGRWPELAREAALGLTVSARERSPLAALLLEILVLMASNAKQQAFSRDIVETLNRYQDGIWAELRKGKTVDELWLSRQLRPYGVRPVIIRDGDRRARGYTIEQMKDTFRRYIPRADYEAFKKELVEEKASDEPANGTTPAADVAATRPDATSSSANIRRNGEPGAEQKAAGPVHADGGIPESCLECGAPLPPAAMGLPRPYTHCPGCGASIPGPSGSSFPEVCLKCGADQPRHGYNAVRATNNCVRCGVKLPALNPRSVMPWLPLKV